MSANGGIIGNTAGSSIKSIDNVTFSNNKTNATYKNQLVKGGVIVDVMELKGFIPSSHLRMGTPFDGLIGQEIEAKILGLDILPFDSRYPNPNIWQPFDNKEAAKMLQRELNKID